MTPPSPLFVADTMPTRGAFTTWVKARIGLERTADGFVLSLALPLARREDVDLSRSGDELVVTVGGHRRVLALPSALKRCVVSAATLVGGRLAIRFEPDPDVWMRTP